MINTTAPTFSIIVPAYNQADYLAKALDSLLSQTDSDWEAVVVNDGSTDHTRRVLGEYAARDSRIRPFHKENGGTATALNKALENARGQWICWLSSDDLFEPDKLSLHREWIDRFPEVRFFFTYFKLLVEATGNLEDRHDLWGPLPERPYQTLGLLRRNFISGITTCVHSDVFRELGGFDESLRYGQDYDRWLWVTSRFPGIFIPEWTVVNRNHAGQGSEVFPQACYFDTAKAAIRFLEIHSFPQLLPMLDITKFDVALDALSAALDIAADSDAFLYWMGVHPALLFNVYAWLSSWKIHGNNGFLWNRLETFAGPEMARNRGHFGSLWRHALMTARLRPFNVERQGITTEAVGRCYHQHLFATRPEQAPGLALYFKKYMNGESLHEIEPNLTGYEIAVVAPLRENPEKEEACFRAARLLAGAGCAVTLVKTGQPAVSYHEGVLILQVPDFDVLSKCIINVRPWHVCAPLENAHVLPADRVVRLSLPAAPIKGCTPIPPHGALASQATAFLGCFSKKGPIPTNSLPMPSLARRAVRYCRNVARTAVNLTLTCKVKCAYSTIRKRMNELLEHCTKRVAARIAAWTIARFCSANEAFDDFKKKGFFLLRDHYYLPLPDFSDLTDSFLASKSKMFGVELNENQMLTLATKTLAPYNEEFRQFPVHCGTTEFKRFYLINGGYMAVDGNLYYGLVRHLKPRNIIETGCGSSSLLCSEALHRNASEGYKTNYICIEPYPQPYLLKNPFLLVNNLIESKIQEIDPNLFMQLQENDIIFIDTTHSLRMGGDVQFIYCEILPRLNPGVYVHIHDISLPRQYPRIYHEEYRYFWNEQYLLQAYLCHNSKAEIIWAGNWLRLCDEDRFNLIFPEFLTMRMYYPQSEPSAFWFRTK